MEGTILRGQLPQCIEANGLSPESPGMTSLVSSVSGIPPAFASIEKRLPTASSGKIFPGIKLFRYGRSNRKTLYVDTLTIYQKLKWKVSDPKMTFDPTSVEFTCVTLPKDHYIQVPWKYPKYVDTVTIVKNLTKRSMAQMTLDDL